MEFYEMPLFVKVVTPSILTSIRWYEEMLDFEVAFAYPDETGSLAMAHLRRTHYQDILLIHDENSTPVNISHIMINLAVNDIHAINQRAAAKDIAAPLTQQPWNAWELTLMTPEKVSLVLTQQLDADKSFQQVMNQLT